MSDSIDWAKYVRDINTSGSTGWVAPKSNYVLPWGPSVKFGVPELLSVDTSKWIALPCTPDLPSGYVGYPLEDSTTTTPKTGTNTKTVNTSNFTEIYFNSLPDYSIEEQLSLASLVGTELLRMSHRENFNTTSLVLNSNILELADTVYSFSPTELIKLQNPDLSYFQNNLSAYTISGGNNDAVVTINIPNYKAEPSYKIEVENIAPKYIKNDTIYT
jgi:hypothetical protein